MAGVIRRLARAVAGQALVTDANHVVLAAEPRDSSDLVDRLRTELVRRRRPGLRFAVASSDGRGHLTIQSLAAASVLRGYLAVATPSAPSELVRLLISHAASLVALELERPREVRAIDRQVRAIVFQLAVDGALDGLVDPSDSAVRFRPASRSQFSQFTVRHHGCRWRTSSKRRSPSVRRHTCSPMSRRDGPSPAGRRRRHSARNWPPPLAPGGGTSSMPASGLYLVVRHRHEPAASHFALRTARAEQRRVVPFEDLGVYSLLFATQPRESIEAVAAAVLRPLDEHDATSRGDLVRSVASFPAQRPLESAAAMLGVHRHTLRYRIRKVEQLTGRRLNSAHDRAEFLVALAAREISDPSALQS